MRSAALFACAVVAACVPRATMTRVTLSDPAERYCHHGRRCDRRVLDLRVDTPLGNVRSVAELSVVTQHQVIPLGMVAGTVLAGYGGGMLAYEYFEHEHIGFGPAPAMLAFGLTLLAIELHARLAADTMTIVRQR